jgi:glucose/arabinose dehydrogenase
MTPRIPHACCVAIAALVASACGGGDSSDGDGTTEEPGSGAVIVTTTTSTTTADGAAPTSTPASAPASAPAEPPEPSTTSASSTTTIPGSTTPGPTTATLPAQDPVVGDPVVGSVVVATVDAPVDLAVRPGDAGLFVVEQPGRVVRVDPATGVTTPIVDLVDRITSGGEQGLLGLEFSADGSLAYADYTDRSGDTVIAEYTVAAEGTIDPASERVLLTVPQPYRNHNGGDLAFGPDGFLYITLGDGGSGGDPERRASDPTSLLGSLLRIDPTPSGTAPYSIPADNPFASGSFEGRAGAPEVWAWGLRNPWKIAFDPTNGDLWIADVGQNAHEEVNLVRADGRPAGFARFFGWSAFEGTEPFNADVDPAGAVPPVLTYPHGGDACSISGGVPYRGTAIPGLEPAYLYSDYCSGILWALDLVGGRNLVLLDDFDGVTAVRAGPDREVYVLEAGGDVSRVIPAPSS